MQEFECLKYYQRTNALAQVKPLPNAAKQSRSPSFTLPCSHAWHNAMGIDAAVVLRERSVEPKRYRFPRDPRDIVTGRLNECVA